jgi:hypothetical protein
MKSGPLREVTKIVTRTVKKLKPQIKTEIYPILA